MYVVVMGCGRVGSSLATALSRLGHEVAVIDREAINDSGAATVGEFLQRNPAIAGASSHDVAREFDRMLAKATRRQRPQDVSRETRVAQEEIFGPVAPIITFSTEEEALEIANDTEYGLASYVFTENSDRLWRIADGLEFGLMGFNAGVISNAAAPFGGVKQSGMGREGGAEGIEEYTSVQYLGIRDPYANA